MAQRTHGQRNFTCRLPPVLLARLTELARERGLPRSDLIERILQQWVYEQEGRS
jgi:predicted transcriptional regulator